MDDIKAIIGTNLKNIRKNNQLTLEEMSKLTEVSISMLGEIERGITNPTITVLWKIANGLKIPFSDLMKEEKPPVSVVHHADANLHLEGEGYRIFSLFNFDPNKKMEVFYKTFEPGTGYSSEGHRVGMEEYIFVSDGALTLNIGDSEYRLSKGDAINFEGNIRHSYRNDESVEASAFMILYYGSKQ